MQNELREFTESVLHINAPAISAFGGSLPGMAGKSAAEQGSMTPSADVIYELKRKVSEFNQAYTDTAKEADKIQKSAKDIEGMLFALQTLSVLNENQTDSLMDQLRNLIANA
jgi:hypothetical protein